MIWKFAIIASAVGGLLCGCSTVPANTLLTREGKTAVMREIMEKKDRIVQVSSPETPADDHRPALLLLHGATEDPTEMMDIVHQWRGKYDVFLYAYDFHQRVEKVAGHFVDEVNRLKAEHRFRGEVTVVVYSYSAIVFRAAVILADEGTFSNVSLIQLVPTAGGSFLARGLKYPFVAWLVSLASKPSWAENPYGRLAEHLWDGEGNRKFYRVIDAERVRTLLVEGDTHSLAGIRNRDVQRRLSNGLGPNFVVIPKSSGVTHDEFPTQPVALDYLRSFLELPPDRAGADLVSGNTKVLKVFAPGESREVSALASWQRLPARLSNAPTQ